MCCCGMLLRFAQSSTALRNMSSSTSSPRTGSTKRPLHLASVAMRSNKANTIRQACSVRSKRTRVCTAPFEWGEMTQIKHTQICSLAPGFLNLLACFENVFLHVCGQRKCRDEGRVRRCSRKGDTARGGNGRRWGSNAGKHAMVNWHTIEDKGMQRCEQEFHPTDNQNISTAST